jgi:hypothetical protein
MKTITALSTSVHGIAFDQKAGFHRIQASVKTEDHSFNGYFYIQTSDEILAVEKGIDLAKDYFLGKTKSIKLTAAELTTSAPQKEPSNGNSKESSKEDQQQDSHKAGQQASGKKSGKGKGKVKSAPAEEEMEEVSSPFSAPAKEADAPNYEAEEEKTPPKTYTKYNRNEKLHTSTLSSFLTSISGSDAWKKKPGVSEFSIGMVGKDFMDKEGDFAPSFKEACMKFLGLDSGL